MEDKGFNVAFVDGKVRIWKKSFKEAIKIGFRVDTLYQVGGSPLWAMTCDTICQTEISPLRFGHLHYKALPEARKVVTGMPEFKNDHEGVCQGCAEREVEICHNVTFDEDSSLKKVINLPSYEEDHDVRSRNQEEPKDEMMPDV